MKKKKNPKDYFNTIYVVMAPSPIAPDPSPMEGSVSSHQVYFELLELYLVSSVRLLKEQIR